VEKSFHSLLTAVLMSRAFVSKNGRNNKRLGSKRCNSHGQQQGKGKLSYWWSPESEMVQLLCPGEGTGSTVYNRCNCWSGWELHCQFSSLEEYKKKSWGLQ